MAKSLPWFRLYSRIVIDPDIEMLSFEDQRHYVWLLCFKNEGYLDKYSDPKKLRAMIGKKLGLQAEALQGAYERLIESELIDENWQPRNWMKLQYISDNSTARVRKHREKQRLKKMKRYSNVTVTPPDTDTDTDTDTDNNKSRVKKSTRFKPPSVDEITDYAQSKNYQNFDADSFWLFYDSKNWMVGKTKMKNWKSSVSLWHNRNKKRNEVTNNEKPKPTAGQQRQSAERDRLQREAEAIKQRIRNGGLAGSS